MKTQRPPALEEQKEQAEEAVGPPGGKAGPGAAPHRPGETLPPQPRAARRPATPPPRPHTYSGRGPALPASRLHSSSRSLSAAEAVSPPLPPLPFRRCRAPRLARARVGKKVELGALRRRRARRHSLWLATVSAEGQKTSTCADTTKL